MQKAKHVVQATVATNATVVSGAATLLSSIAVNAAQRTHARAVALLAVRAARNAKRAQQRNQQAYMLAVAQLATQYGVAAPVHNAVVVAANARANSATVAPSRELVVVNGVGYKPCKAVHALCALLPADATRAQQLEICKDNGINAATASTQVGIYRKAAAAAAAAAE
jgi:hypothetical protein